MKKINILIIKKKTIRNISKKIKRNKAEINIEIANFYLINLLFIV